jgi:hypothetical protein
VADPGVLHEPVLRADHRPDGRVRPPPPKAAFVHVEVWQDFEKRQVNKAAADWLLRQGDLHEPWAFVIGPDGKITTT